AAIAGRLIVDIDSAGAVRLVDALEQRLTEVRLGRPGHRSVRRRERRARLISGADRPDRGGRHPGAEETDLISSEEQVAPVHGMAALRLLAGGARIVNRVATGTGRSAGGDRSVGPPTAGARSA